MYNNKSLLLIVICLTILLQIPGMRLSGQTSDSSISIKFFTKADVGVGIGLGYFKTDITSKGYQLKIRNDEILYTVNSINGILFSERTGLGIGVGIQPWKDALLFPVFLHLFYDLEPKENTFYGTISAGYSFGKRYSTVFYESGTGGFMFNIGIGYKSKISKRVKFEYGVFYNYQAIKSKYYIHSDSANIPPVEVNYTVPYHFAGFKLGLEFH
jgi:hypothetical protein